MLKDYLGKVKFNVFLVLSSRFTDNCIENTFTFDFGLNQKRRMCLCDSDTCYVPTDQYNWIKCSCAKFGRIQNSNWAVTNPISISFVPLRAELSNFITDNAVIACHDSFSGALLQYGLTSPPTLNLSSYWVNFSLEELMGCRVVSLTVNHNRTSLFHPIL